MLFPPEPPAQAAMSVTDVARYIKTLLDTDEVMQQVQVRGEISGYRSVASSGHIYFTLKDADAQLPCAYFKWSRLRHPPVTLREGMSVVASGHISMYERDGKVQLYVEYVEPLGTGELYVRFEQLKARLRDEGLFDEDRKRAIPPAPATIGIVTSLEAAALRDMLRVLRVRYPVGRIVIAPSLVQGAEAPAAIVQALDQLNEHGEADVIIVARGGGSIEDLWAFNEEIVARAIARSRVPVISGVGHETDTTIADFVADQRASTPTAAANAAVPDCADWLADTQHYQHQLTQLIKTNLQGTGDHLTRTRRELVRQSPQARLERMQQQLDDTTSTLIASIQHRQELLRTRLESTQQRLQALSPQQTIARGFAVVRHAEGIITSVGQVRPGEALDIQVTDGHFAARVAE
jgi:exodeoxyribonuclease VII large subunit